MEEKQFHNFQKLIDNLSKEDLMKIKIIIEDKLCGNRDILNLNLEDFLNREKYLTNFKGRLYINDIINAVGHYCHIPNDKVKVYDLIGIDLNLFTKQYHIGNTTIKYLENFLNNYGHSLRESNEEINSLQEKRQAENLDILNYTLDNFIASHTPSYDINIIRYSQTIVKNKIATILNKKPQDVTVSDTLRFTNELKEYKFYYYFQKALSRYPDISLQENYQYLLK